MVEIGPPDNGRSGESQVFIGRMNPGMRLDCIYRFAVRSFGMIRSSLPFLASVFLAKTALAEPLISEFLAQNNTGLKDTDGETYDWIEIHNPDSEALNLEGYALTDSEKELDGWKFPKVSLPAGGYLVLFASGLEKEINVAASIDPKRQRLLDWGISEEFIESMSPERVEEILERLERRQRRVRLPNRPTKRAPAMHVPFKLDGKGEYLALVKPDGKTVCHAYAPKFPDQHDDVSYGRIGTTDEYGRLLEPTPGEPNSEKLLGIVKPLYLSQSGGHFEKPFKLELETSTAGAEIRYTINGDEPTIDVGRIYTGPLAISKTTTLRVAAFKPKHKAARVVTRTFLFLDDIIRTPKHVPPPGWPDGYVNQQEMDYGMDTAIVGRLHTAEEVKASLQSLPSLSIVAPIKSLFDSTTGIYANARGRGRHWERAASVELLNQDGSKGFQVNGGLRARGGFSRQGRNPKHGFRMIFRKEYGNGKLKYPLFEDEGVKEFDKIDFRSSMNYSWAFDGGNQNTLLRDVWSRDTQGAMGQPYTRTRFYHLYLNGHYWGIYMTQERSEATFGAVYLGGNKEDYDTVKTHGEVTDGNGEAGERLYQIASRGFEDDAVYFKVQGMNPDGQRNPEFERLVDIDNIIDYMLITFYTGDKDGPGGVFSKGNNYFSIYNRVKPDGFKFFEHDSEHSLGLGEDDMTGQFLAGDRSRRSRGSASNGKFNVHWLHTRLVENRQYLNRFTKRAEQHLFGSGVLTAEAGLARLKVRKDTIDQAIIAHSARWGGSNRSRQTWLRAVEGIETFIEGRHEPLLQQLHDRGWYAGLPAPRFTRSSGTVSMSAKVFAVGGEGTIYVTTDGTDPRDPNEKPATSAQRARIPTIEHTILLGDRAPARAYVPWNRALGLSWIQPKFDDRAWTPGRTGIGYDTQGDYADLIGIDFRGAMKERELTTAYIRVPFTLSKAHLEGFDELTLGMRYDDGFIAYLNGQQVAAANAPSRPQWDSQAVTDNPEGEAIKFNDRPLDDASKLLREGENLLAIHGMDGTASSDFLITPRIQGIRYTGAEPISIKASGTTRIRARSLLDGKWSPLAEITVTRKP